MDALFASHLLPVYYMVTAPVLLEYDDPGKAGDDSRGYFHHS